MVKQFNAAVPSTASQEGRGPHAQCQEAAPCSNVQQRKSNPHSEEQRITFPIHHSIALIFFTSLIFLTHHRHSHLHILGLLLVFKRSSSGVASNIPERSEIVPYLGSA